MKMAELADNKLSILFFAQCLRIPLTNEQITEFFITKYLMNYFELQQLLSELVESRHLSYMEGRQSHYYTLTDKGKEALHFFHSRIDYQTREMIETYADQNRDRIRKESQLTAEYRRLSSNEYEVLLRVMEKDITLMELHLNVTDASQAKTICSNWRAKAPAVYKKIMETLI